MKKEQIPDSLKKKKIEGFLDSLVVRILVNQNKKSLNNFYNILNTLEKKGYKSYLGNYWGIYEELKEEYGDSS